MPDLQLPMVVVLDFDGTITTHDTSDALFSEFGDFHSLIQQLLDGSLTVAEYYTAAFASLSSDCTPDRLIHWLEQRTVDTGFIGLVAWLRSKNIPVRIVSDGFDFYIHPILQRVGVSDLSVSCNTACWTGERFVPAYPHATDGCTGVSASCKRNAVLRGVADDVVIVYVGDGRSDTCAVQHADIVFAKSYLAAWCTEQRIPHHPFKTLADVQRILASSLQLGKLKQRRQATLARRNAYMEE